MTCVITSPCSGPSGDAKEYMSVCPGDSDCRAEPEAYRGVWLGRLGGETEPRTGAVVQYLRLLVGAERRTRILASVFLSQLQGKHPQR